METCGIGMGSDSLLIGSKKSCEAKFDAPQSGHVVCVFMTKCLQDRQKPSSSFDVDDLNIFKRKTNSCVIKKYSQSICMIDPLSFAVGGATVMLSRVVISAVLQYQHPTVITLPQQQPPAPPQLPMSKVRVRVYVKNLKGLLNRDGNAEIPGDGGGIGKPSATVQDHSNGPGLSKCVTLDELRSIKLKPQSHPTPRKSTAVNECVTCCEFVTKKSTLKRVTTNNPQLRACV
jgi:hypothetical protein